MLNLLWWYILRTTQLSSELLTVCFFFIQHFVSGVSVQPSSPEVAVSEGGDGDGGGTGGTGSDPQAMVCVELTSGNLQRNVSVRVMTISSPTATGLLQTKYRLAG